MTSKTERDRYQEMRILSDENSETGSMLKDLAKLEQLVNALKQTLSARFSGSPASVVLQVLSDSVALFSELFLRARPFWTRPANYPGLKFVESLRVPGGTPLSISQGTRPQQATPSQMKRVGTRGPSYTSVVGEFSGTQRNKFGEKEGKASQIIVGTISKDYSKEVHYDPLTKQDYVYLDDSLGNPLQVSIDLDTPPISWEAKDRNTLINFFEDLDQFFVLLSSGKIDYRLVKVLRRTMNERTKISTPSSSNPGKPHKKQDKSHFYFKRKQPGIPKGDKQ